ncbi:hypothetical protein MVES_001861 [Malassezia vespertilionis]|uniref:Uncharacterized protein n=1 Tax=Malassezia vespertilionis TaxID=2020962 RepID=A0A2N1JBN0_9BASI|nr:hypothetical protein MVES_001861 [Malassezia vespertilionis]
MTNPSTLLPPRAERVYGMSPTQYPDAQPTLLTQARLEEKEPSTLPIHISMTDRVLQDRRDAQMHTNRRQRRSETGKFSQQSFSPPPPGLAMSQSSESTMDTLSKSSGSPFQEATVPKEEVPVLEPAARSTRSAERLAAGSGVAAVPLRARSNSIAQKHDSKVLFDDTKGRSERMSMLTYDEVALTTEELEADIAQARYAMHLFLNSRMTEAYEHVSAKSERRLYYAVAFALLSTIKGVMTFEREDLATAISHCRDALTVASLLRKRASAISCFGRFVRGVGPSVSWVASMTPVERHAELVYAECALLKAVLGIALSGDLFGFLSEALNLRSAYGTYHSLLKYIEWEDESPEARKRGIHSDNDFRSGVYLGAGCMSLILGLLPGKLLKVMEVFGYEGDVAVGLELLSKSGGWSAAPTPGISTEKEGIRRVLCDMTMLTYHLVVSTFVPVPDVDIPFAAKLLNFHLARYPEGVFFLYFHGRLYSTQSLSREAIRCFQRARDIQEEYVQLKHICYWDMALCNMSLGQWQDTYVDFTILAEENNWSKAVYTYGRAAMLYQSGDRTKIQQAQEIFATVQSKTQKIAGKSIPLEKFVARKANKIQAQGHLVLPAMEFAYMTHCYTTAAHSSLTCTLLPMVEQKLNELEASAGAEMDDVCLAHFLRGVILRNIAYPEQHTKFRARDRRIPVAEAARAAEENLQFVATNGTQLVYDHYLLYFSHYELGRLYISQRRDKEARHELELVLSGKNLGEQGRKGKYSMQNMAALRSNGALDLLR